LKTIVIIIYSLVSVICLNPADHPTAINFVAIGDTVVGSRIITNEIAGSAYRKRAKAYFLVVDNDTSEFTCILSEAREGGNTNMELRKLKSGAYTTSYRQRLNELKKILPRAAADFSFDSLNSVSLGRLITLGDLAIAVTGQYRQKFGPGNKIPEYKKMSAFLLTSQLSSDFNELFAPFSLSVKSISIEKAFFAGSKELKWHSKIETGSTLVPDKILDCITWIRMK
jgi:hypothetical protein